jgi:RsiW-degrading membrane proteinase PrsW (M82 family)
MADTLVFVLSLLPGLAWLFFYLQEDLHPEPKRMLLAVFFTGAGSAFLAYFIQVDLNELILGPWGVQPYSPLSLLALAFVEEFVKFGAAWVIIHNSPEFDEPVDAMVYMVVAALGFATLENLGALNSPEHLADYGLVFETTSLRFVGATLLHTLASGLMGYYWAQYVRTFDTKRFLLYGILAATLLHAFFNYLIISYGDLSYALLFVVIVGFFILSDFEKLRDKTV